VVEEPAIEEYDDPADEALDALQAKLASGEEVDDAEISDDWTTWVQDRIDAQAVRPAGKGRDRGLRLWEATVADLITEFEERLLASEEVEYDRILLVIRGPQ
jgi:hypothetical protein